VKHVSGHSILRNRQPGKWLSLGIMHYAGLTGTGSSSVRGIPGPTPTMCPTSVRLLLSLMLLLTSRVFISMGNIGRLVEG